MPCPTLAHARIDSPASRMRAQQTSVDFEEGTRLGQFCILCECIRPNEAFGDKGERARI
jgi:hypothetical protein